ncbi:MAG: hypothetical protein R2932_49950 [Caldilineaceae bacterium]
MMIYLIGGAPRTGKSILGQQLAAKLNTNWISTDLLVQLLKVKEVAGAPTEWNAAPPVIAERAVWFFPCLERFVWGASSLAEHYVIEGVDFLPAQVAQLAPQFPIRSVFLGCSTMTLEHFDRFPGRSQGYANLPEQMRRQFAQDVPRWSAFVQQEAARFALAYIDTSGNFSAHLQAAEALLRAE